VYPLAPLSPLSPLLGTDRTDRTVISGCARSLKGVLTSRRQALPKIGPLERTRTSFPRPRIPRQMRATRGKSAVGKFPPKNEGLARWQPPSPRPNRRWS
jgi:hypothetical protein